MNSAQPTDSPQVPTPTLAMVTTILGTLLLLFALLAWRTGMGWFAKRWRWCSQWREREQMALTSLPEYPDPS